MTPDTDDTEENQEVFPQFGNTHLGDGLGCAAMMLAAGFGLAAIILAMKYGASL